MTLCTLSRRQVNPLALSQLKQNLPKLSVLEAQLLASRGETGESLSLAALLQRPLADLEAGAIRIEQAIARQEKMVVVADYDCDGATACALMLAGLRALGGLIDYVVPDRMVHGYGISPSVVDLAKDSCPDVRLVITVDNGIMGHSGILHAHSMGIDVVVTDHHLPGADLPDAVAVIDPSRADCSSGLTKLAGVGVALWLVSAVKRRLVAAGKNTPPLNFLLPYLAIGTVADMVGLDKANRHLIDAGLDLMRNGKAPIGITALMGVAELNAATMTTQDIGFGLGPRINAAGRLESMTAGIDLLLATDPKEAHRLAKMLDGINQERKKLQQNATDEISFILDFSFTDDMPALVEGRPEWHPGIIGLIASKMKERFFRPSFAFHISEEAGGKAKGSGRSIPGIHLKDVLEEVARREPGLLYKFGGHSMAAGVTLSAQGTVQDFNRVFSAVVKERLTPEMLEVSVLSDGLPPILALSDAIRMLKHPWGQGFEWPQFDCETKFTDLKPLGKSGKHWKAITQFPGSKSKQEVVLFNTDEPPVDQDVQLLLTPGLNTWRGDTSLQWQAKVLH